MTLAALKQATPVFVGLSLLGMASTLLASLVGLQMTHESFPDWTLGLIGAGFALGGIIGANVSVDIILRAGHLRSFAALSATLACVALSHALVVSPITWGFFRVATGVCYYGAVLVAESWLNRIATPQTRGQILAIYMVVFFASGAVGQLLLNVSAPGENQLFIIAGMLLAISVVPLTLMRSDEPTELAAGRIPVIRLLQNAPIAVVGALCAGVITGVYYALGAVYGNRVGMSTEEVSIFLASAISGALILQWPIGWTSDQIPRKYVISVAAAVAALSAYGILELREAGIWLYVTAFVFGGSAFSLYPLSLSQAGDSVHGSQIIGLSRSFLTVFAAGSFLGPALGGLLIELVDASAIFGLTAVAAILLAISAPFAHQLPRIVQTAFVSVPVASLEASALDPRQDPAQDVTATT